MRNMSEPNNKLNNNENMELTRDYTNIDWHIVDCLLQFFYETVLALIPNLWEQRANCSNQVSVRISSSLKVLGLFKKIHSKYVNIDANKNIYFTKIVSFITTNYPGVKVMDFVNLGHCQLIQLMALASDQLEKAYNYILSQLTSLVPQSLTQGPSASNLDTSGYATSNTDQQSQTVACFDLLNRMKLYVCSKDVNACNVDAVISTQNQVYRDIVTVVPDGNSKYMFYVKEPDRNLAIGNHKSEEYITDVYYQCFTKAAFLNISSVATTLIFTGKLGVSMDTVLFAINQSLKDFMNDNIYDYTLQEIYIVDYSTEICSTIEGIFNLFWSQRHSASNQERSQGSFVDSYPQSVDYPTHQLASLSLHENPRSGAVHEQRSKINVNSRPSEEECQICFQKLTRKRKLKCNHSFCHHCLETWFLQKQTCPLCRAAVT